MPMGEGVVLVVVGLGYVAIMGASAWRAWATLRLAQASAAWRTVDGVVMSANVVHDVVRSGRYERRVYVPSVQYEYHVGGDRFVSDAVAVSRPEDPAFAPIEALVRPYRAGARVTVYVHPERPERAALRPGARPQDRRRLVGSLVHVAIGVGVAALGVRLW